MVACQVCHNMLAYSKGRKRSAIGLNFVRFSHHQHLDHVISSAEQSNCYICRVLWRKLEKIRELSPSSVKESDGGFLIAKLTHFKAQELYGLVFQLEATDRHVASFVLEKASVEEEPHVELEYPISSHTSSDKVIELAKSWITECSEKHQECQPFRAELWYPTRLLDIQISASRDDSDTIRVVSQKEDEILPSQPAFSGKYVTLSHCWGSAQFKKLEDANRAAFQQTIHVRDLARTFQDAIKFARRLGVRWLWIDALCILQGNDEDWLHEAAQMEKVYQRSYCNISATAARNSAEGLFRDRNPEHLWFDRVQLKLVGPDSFSTDSVTTCMITDLDSWVEDVNNAPVNRRSWVYQERLLSPRVLHWCKDQIAFECRLSQRAESRLQDLPHYQMVGAQIVSPPGLKVISKEIGRQLREIRLGLGRQNMSNPQALQGMIDKSDDNLYYYEIWKRLVEDYTRMAITNHRDRLIALSGIVRMFISTMKASDYRDQYLAGMWNKYLASQLLWYVDDETVHHIASGENRRPEKYRAPSFSWASIETSRGITFPESTDKGLLVEVQRVRLIYRSKADEYGLLTDGYLILKGTLRRVNLVCTSDPKPLEEPKEPEQPLEMEVEKREDFSSVIAQLRSLSPTLLVLVLFFLQLRELASLLVKLLFDLKPASQAASVAQSDSALPSDPPIVPVPSFGSMLTDGSLEEDEYRLHLVRDDGTSSQEHYGSLYLDNPVADPSIFGVDAQVFCLPILEDSDFIRCLLVKATDGNYGIRYRRIGMVRIATFNPDEYDAIKMIKHRPGHLIDASGDAKGRYFQGSNDTFDGESLICII